MNNINERKIYPTYNLAVEAFKKNDDKTFSRLINSKLISFNEQKLLKARNFLRKSKTQDALKLLIDIKITNKIFLQAEKNALLATTYSFLANYEFAIEHNLIALNLYQKIFDRLGIFLTNYNLSVDFARIGVLHISNYYLKIAEKHIQESNEKVLVFRAYACSFSKKGDYQKASQWLQKALDSRDFLREQDKYVLDTTAVDIYYRIGNFKDAISHILKLKKNPNNRSRIRLDFKLSLLQSLQNNTPLKTLPKKLVDSFEYKNKWLILKSLQAGDRKSAEEYWKNLQTKYPNRFDIPFKAVNKNDSDDLFMDYLEKLKKVNESVILNPFKIGTKSFILLDTLIKSPFSICKEELIEKIWNTQYCPKLNSRFYKLIERVKIKNVAQIINTRNSYQIII